MGRTNERKIPETNKKIILATAERSFRRACEQIVLLNQRLDEVQVRYEAARDNNARAFRYNLRLKLAIVEGMRNVYYDYAHTKAKLVANLRRELYNEVVQIVTEDDPNGERDGDRLEMEEGGENDEEAEGDDIVPINLTAMEFNNTNSAM